MVEPPLAQLDHLVEPVPRRELKIKEGANIGTYIEGLTTIKVSSAKEIFDILKIGQ